MHPLPHGRGSEALPPSRERERPVLRMLTMPLVLTKDLRASWRHRNRIASHYEAASRVGKCQPNRKTHAGLDDGIVA